jgi:hypothetical protein
VETKVIAPNDGRELDLVARDSNTLLESTRFHLEMDGFATEEAARAYGEHLRTCLQVLNAALNLGLTIPNQDLRSANVSSDFKNAQFEQHGVTLIDSIVGLATFPADGKHAEVVAAGALNTYPSDPEYILSAIRMLVEQETFSFNERQTDALEILGRATAELSPRTRFLLCYLALERVVEVGERSETAKSLLQSFIERTVAELPESEAAPLTGALRSLHRDSFPNALRLLATRIREPKEIGGRLMSDFFSECVRVRNRIAHNASTMDMNELANLGNELRQVVLSLIWSASNLPPVNIEVPRQMVQMEKFEIRLL